MSSSMLSGEFLLGFLESYPAAASVFELDGTMVFVNQRGCDFTNKSKEELIGKRVQDFVADRAMAESIISRIVSKGYIETEMSVTQSNGDVVGIRLTGVLVKDSKGKPVGVVGMARGTTTALGKSREIALAVQRILNQLPEAKMLTVEEVANELRVSKETVRRWVRNGQLPCIKLPRGIRIPSEVIKDLIRLNLR
ncbi:MAG: helix-turn-helix domain-containing protein [Chloroflexi bacterium]|nr:helix-turn-helix domain-containing protein [Chloroflexota bacterium]